MSLFYYALLCVHSSFSIILKRKRKLVILLLLSYRCIFTINVLWLLLTVPWVGLQCVIVVFPDHTHFFIDYCKLITEYGWMAINSVKYNSNHSTIWSNFFENVQHDVYLAAFTLIQRGTIVWTPPHPSGKSLVVIRFLRNTGKDTPSRSNWTPSKIS